MQGTRVHRPSFDWDLHGQEDLPDMQRKIVGPMKVRGREVMFIGSMVTDEIKDATFICEHCDFFDVLGTHPLTDDSLTRRNEYTCPRSICNAGLFISLPKYAIMRLEGELE